MSQCRAEQIEAPRLSDFQGNQPASSSLPQDLGTSGNSAQAASGRQPHVRVIKCITADWCPQE